MEVLAALFLLFVVYKFFSQLFRRSVELGHRLTGRPEHERWPEVVPESERASSSTSK